MGPIPIPAVGGGSLKPRWTGMWNRKKSNTNADNKKIQVDKGLPKVRLSASDKTGQTESSIVVLKQRDYTGRVVLSTVADTPCADLGVDGMLETLNVIAPVCTPDSPLYKTCKYFIGEGYDFGTAYAYLRPHLYDFDADTHVTIALHKDEEMRQNLLKNKKISDGDAPPRRVWDLHANRVVPWWAARTCTWAISHAWLEDEDMKWEMTPINGYEWPVPMPKDADLNLIRIEMLNLGAEYIWLDVLCLRQQGGREELLRKNEWKVDLPTIGWIYHEAERVVCYFSGLGRPLSFKPGEFDGDRCWFNRAWTLQEIRDNPIIAGETHDDDEFMSEDVNKLFHTKLASLQCMRREDSIFTVLSQMQKRKSTSPVDKVAGLVYLFYSKYIPIYDAEQSEEDAWTELVNVTQTWFRADFLFLYPKPGNGNRVWRPSWEQVMMDTLPEPSLSLSENYLATEVCRAEDGDLYRGPCIDSCRVRGLAADASIPGRPRCGELDVIDQPGIEHTFKIVADHAYPIPDGVYTLLGSNIHAKETMKWVAGKTEDGKFKKVSVFRLADDTQKRTIYKYMDRHTRTFLI